MAEILDESEIDKTLTRISHEILEKNKDINNIVLIGIKDRGDIIAKRISIKINEICKKDVPVGAMDITFYRDDIREKKLLPKHTNINFNLSDKIVILIDDVLYTGRSVRAALDEIIDFGRPRAIQLAVLIDRGHREFPIHADYVGKNIPTSANDKVEVKIKEIDGDDKVTVKEFEKILADL